MMRRVPPLKYNVLANYLAQGWVAAMGFAFVPLYIRYLGIEAYGIIGLFAVLQSAFVILDFGMTPTLMREMARFTGGRYTILEIRDLLRSIEAIAVSVALVIVLSLWASSRWLAVSWFNPQHLQPGEIARAVAVMGLVIALRFLEGVYRGAVLGLQRQVLFSLLNALFATLRGLGAVAVLAFVSPRLDAFFLWQALVSFASASTLMLTTYALLPSGARSGRFSLPALRKVSGFTLGVLGISALGLLLTQSDKVLLSRLLPLSDYAKYSLAAVVAGALEMLVAPLFQALTPRFSQLHAEADEPGFVRLYHDASQLVSITAGTAGLFLAIHARPLLSLWTGNPSLAGETALLLRLLALGYLFNLLMWVPYQAQLAYRWTSLTIRISLFSVALFIPLMLLLVPRYGGIGAASLWLGLNLLFFFLNVHMMHRRILRLEKWNWYLKDVMVPLAGAGAVLAVGSVLQLPPDSFGRVGKLAALAFEGGCAMAAAVLCASFYRERVRLLLVRRPARG